MDLEASIAVVLEGDRILLRRAESSELLAGHWTLPEEGMLPPGWFIPTGASGVVRHAITHHRIVWTVRRGKGASGEAPPGMEWKRSNDLGTLLVSSLPRKALRVVGTPPEKP